MPATYQKKMYGTVRRGTINKSFRGSVQAWDKQRKQPAGLLRQQPPAPSNENQPPVVRKPTCPYDDDDQDSFLLESPPESPVSERIMLASKDPILPKFVVEIPVKATFIEVERKETAQVLEDAAISMPRPSGRRPLAPKSNNASNAKAYQTPKKSTSKKRKSPFKKLVPARTKEDIPVAARQASPAPISQENDCSPASASAPHQLTESRTVTTGRRSFICSMGSPEARSTPVETSAVEILSSHLEEIGLDNDQAETEPQTDTVDDTNDEQDQDESVVLSPQQRKALQVGQRKKRGKSELEENETDPFPFSPAKIPSKPAVPEQTSIVQPDFKECITPGLAVESKVFKFLESCDANRVVTFDEYLKTISPDFSTIRKIGQSSFAEVFLHKRDDGVPVVLKLVPLESEEGVMEILEELKITKALSPINGFIKFVGCQVVAGGIPVELEAAWRRWEEKKDPEEYDPEDEMFAGIEHHAVIALEDGGCELDETKWSTWDVPLEIFRQTLSALAEAEKLHRFEHRDLHGGNILVKNIGAKIKEAEDDSSNVRRNLEVKSYKDVQVTLIDYTLSRADIPQEQGGGIASVQIVQDVFESFGLYQFAIYKFMAEELRLHTKRGKAIKGSKLDWSTYIPRTNVLWLHYLVHNLIRTDGGIKNSGKPRMRKPRASKKNSFELACWNSMMRIQDELDYDPVTGLGQGPRSAGDILEWCEDNKLFDQLKYDVEDKPQDSDGATDVQPRRSNRIRHAKS